MASSDVDDPVATVDVIPEARGVAANSIGVRGLSGIGIQWSESVEVRTRLREARGAMAFSLESSRSADLIVDTAAVHPDHAAFLFVTSNAPRGPGRGNADSSYLMHAPRGAVARMRCRRRWRVTGALIHRPAVEPLIQGIRGDSRVYTDSRQLERSMMSFIDVILAADTAPSSIERYAIAQLLTEMGGAVLLERNGVRPTNSREILRQRALALIAGQSSDRNLTPSAVAREVQVSLRTLQAVFSDAGSSLFEEIRRQRARSAHELLTDRRWSALDLDEVAEHAGFGSTMSLRRALREEYGASPRTLRRL